MKFPVANNGGVKWGIFLLGVAEDVRRAVWGQLARVLNGSRRSVYLKI